MSNAKIITKLAKTNSALLAGIVIVASFALMALISSFWTPHNVAAIDAQNTLAPPSMQHPFGTNQFGRDVFSMMMVGAQTTISIAFFAVSAALLIGTPLGLIAGAFKFADEAIMRTSDVVFAFPAIILAILLAAVFGPSATNAAIAIAVFNIPVFARVTRGAALPLWTMNYVTAARALGKDRLTISLEHILPNLAPVLIVQASVQFSMAVLAEAGLSYVGLGVQPPMPSWGHMLAESQTMASFAPWLVLVPGLAIFLFVIGVNLIADGLRQQIDQRDPS